MRAGHVACQFGSMGPPASLSFVVMHVRSRQLLIAASWIMVLALFVAVAYVLPRGPGVSAQSVEELKSHARVVDKEALHAMRLLNFVRAADQNLGIRSNAVTRPVEDFLDNRVRMRERERIAAESKIAILRTLGENNAERNAINDRPLRDN